MTNKSTTLENAVSRRHFLLSASLATTALSLKPLTGTGAPARVSPARGDAPGELCLWYDRPAQTWMTEALPIGNGPMGAMLFGGTEIERIQFNEISRTRECRFAAPILALRLPGDNRAGLEATDRHGDAGSEKPSPGGRFGETMPVV